MPPLSVVGRPRLPRRAGWVRHLFPFLFCFLVLTLPSHAGVVTDITTAEFADDLDGPWHGVSLPDTRQKRGASFTARSHYRAQFTLETPPTEVWDLRIDRLGSRHAVSVNGHLVTSTLRASIGTNRPVPTVISLPPDLLHAGRNDIAITVENGSRAGLSPLQVGPAGSLAGGAARWRIHEGATPLQVLNTAGAAIGLFMLLLWHLRRSEVALGCFGALTLVASLRNQAYALAEAPLPEPLMDWFYFAAQIASVALLGRFAMAFAQASNHVYRRALTATAVLMPPAAAVAVWAGRSQMARAFMYPWLMTLVLPALWILWRRARQQPSVAEWSLLGSLTIALGAGLHDYAYQQGFTSVMDTYWMPYAIPLALCGFSVMLVQRLVSALEGIEKLNVTLERRVVERTRELRAANRAKSRFLAFASHDLRQPMVSIGLLVALLRDQLHTPAHLRLVQRLQDATASMEALLKRLLDFSRLESGAVQVRRQAVPLQRLFDAVATHHAELARHKGLRLVMRPTACVADTDPLLLEQILRNLVGNAVHHTGRGGVLVGVRRSGAGRVRLEVWDTGVGIPLEQQRDIFDAFVQLDTLQPQPVPDPERGVGLGLAIVQRCAALLEVPVTLRSRPGRGSCFSVELPASDG